jgi:hypothetical protein
MKKIYNKILHRLLVPKLAGCDFEPLEVPAEQRHSSNARVFVSRKYPPVLFFVEVKPHTSWDKYYVAWGWSTLGRFKKRASSFLKDPDENHILHEEFREFLIGDLEWRYPDSEVNCYEFILEETDPSPGLRIPAGRIQPPKTMTEPEERVLYTLEHVVSILKTNCDWMFSRIQKCHIELQKKEQHDV